MPPTPNAYGAKGWKSDQKKPRQISNLCNLRTFVSWQGFTRGRGHKRQQRNTGSREMAASRLLGQFRLSGAMRPYVLRIKLRGSDFDFGATPERALAFTKCIGEMRRILMEKRRVPALTANRAILKSLEAAIDFQLADLRYRDLKAMEA